MNIPGPVTSLTPGNAWLTQLVASPVTELLVSCWLMRINLPLWCRRGCGVVMMLLWCGCGVDVNPEISLDGVDCSCKQGNTYTQMITEVDCRN